MATGIIEDYLLRPDKGEVGCFQLKELPSRGRFYKLRITTQITVLSRKKVKTSVTGKIYLYKDGTDILLHDAEHEESSLEGIITWAKNLIESRYGFQS